MSYQSAQSDDSAPLSEAECRRLLDDLAAQALIVFEESL